MTVCWMHAADAMSVYRESAMLLRLRGRDAIEALQECQAKAQEAAQGRDDLGDEIKAALAVLQSYQGQLDVPARVLHAACIAYTRLVAETESEEEEEAAAASDGPSSSDTAREERFWRSVVQGSKAVFPLSDRRKAEAKARLEQSAAYSQRLRIRDQQRQYDRMVNNVHWGGAKPKEAEARGMYQASVALNMVTAAGTAGFVAYYLGRQVFKKESHSVIFGGAAAVMLLMVEMILYIIRSYELERFRGHREKMERMGQLGMQIPQTQQLWGGGTSASEPPPLARRKAKQQ